MNVISILARLPNVQPKNNLDISSRVETDEDTEPQKSHFSTFIPIILPKYFLQHCEQSAKKNFLCHYSLLEF